MLEQLFDPRILLVTAPVVLFSLSLHEFMHAWMADRLGDPTARYAGRLTINPLAHYDLIGTTFGLLFRVFGWAKPVPTNTVLFKWPKRDMMLTALAGPMVNFALALCFGITFKLVQLGQGPVDAAGPTLRLVENMAAYGVFLNLALGLFNLIPLRPLDGHHILRGFLSFKATTAYDRFQQYGSYILMGLILLSCLGSGPPILSIVIGRPILFVVNLAFTGPETVKLWRIVMQHIPAF